jgi:hypothetical protein
LIEEIGTQKNHHQLQIQENVPPLAIIFQSYRGGHFYWWRKLEYPEKTTEPPQVIDKLIT